MTDPNLTRLAILADRSGSMRHIQRDMNGGIAQLLADQAKAPGAVVVDITTFDDRIDFPYEGVRPDDVKSDIIQARGMTALNDAIGMTITRLGETLAALPEEDRPGHVIFVIVTDGQENSSHEYTSEQVREMVTEQREQWGWEFVFLAANVDAFAVGNSYGFNAGQTMQYAPTAKGASSSFAGATRSVIATRSGLDSDFTEDEREAAAS